MAKKFEKNREIKNVKSDKKRTANSIVIGLQIELEIWMQIGLQIISKIEVKITAKI